MSTIAPEIPSTDIQLHPLSPDDAPRLYELVDTNRPQLHKFWWEQRTQSPEDSRNFIEAVSADEASNGAPTRGIYAQGRLVGVAALHTIDWEEKRSLMGYWIDKNESGKGYTTAAVRQLIDEAFDHIGLDEVRITARTSNEASLAIAKRLGFTLLGVQDEPTWRTDEHVETAIYSLSKEHHQSQSVAL
jgi:ribosomal-protein-serine acetyltransferase